MGALRNAEAELTVYVHPSNAKRYRHAVDRQLSSLLFTYDDRFDGVLLAHEVTVQIDEDKKDEQVGEDKKGVQVGEDKKGQPKDKNGEPKDKSGEPESCIKAKVMKGKPKDEDGEPKNRSGEPKSCVKAKVMKGKPKDEDGEPKGKCDKPKSYVKAKIMNGLVPYFGVQVHAKLLLFSPKPDMILEGKVEMLGKESIHAIVLGVFSVAIMSNDIREKFSFKRKSDGGQFVSRTDKDHVIKRGTMIRFSVKRVDTEMNCHITGSLIPPHTGCMCWLSVHDDEYKSEINSDKRESRDISIKAEQNEQERRIVKYEDSMVRSERPYKSKKRKRHSDK